MNKFKLPHIQQEKEPLRILGPAGEIFEFLRTGESTCGKYVISKTIVPPGIGPTPHVHHSTDEWFYTPNGGIVLFMGQNEYTDLKIEAGNDAPKEVLHAIDMGEDELIYVPRHHIHAFINNTEESQLLYMIWTPDTNDVSIVNYFKKVGQHLTDMNDIPAVEPLAKVRFVSEAPKFGINQSHDFWQYVVTVDHTPIEMNNHSEELLCLLRDGDIGFKA